MLRTLEKKLQVNDFIIFCEWMHKAAITNFSFRCDVAERMSKQRRVRKGEKVR